ncbi:MAG TPA: DUF1641 domain-containing protein [Virgibacillus sp.]|nr:DUF1641 domain-containing protein [Virgibacillus sp.]
MAKPITNIERMKVSSRTIEKENISQITEAISENKEAVLKGIQLLATVHESGILDMLHAVIKQRDVALANLVNELNKPKYTATLENLNKLFLFLGELNMDELHHLVQKVNEGLVDVRQLTSDKKTSYIDLLKAMRDPDINKSVTMLLQFLRGMGSAI